MAISLETATRLSMELVRVMKLFGSMGTHAPKVHPGVEPASYPILFSLTAGPQRVSLLAEHVYSDVSTVSRQVTTLVSHGLLEKVTDPHLTAGSAWSRSATKAWRWWSISRPAAASGSVG
jgi:DNA-binding MarR family transcriptional regulator